MPELTTHQRIHILARTQPTWSLRQVGETLGVSRETVQESLMRTWPERCIPVVRSGPKRKPRVTITCPTCEGEFTVPASHGHRIYCSPQCITSTPFVRNENSRGVRAYALKRGGLTWHQVAVALELRDATRAINVAKCAALTRGWKWPLSGRPRKKWRKRK